MKTPNYKAWARKKGGIGTSKDFADVAKVLARNYDKSAVAVIEAGKALKKAIGPNRYSEEDFRRAGKTLEKSTHQYGLAGEMYERAGDYTQAEKMYASAGMKTKAAEMREISEGIRNERLRGLEIAMGIFGFAFSFLFLSANFTGYSIFNLSASNYNLIGACLFIIGILGLFFYFKKR